MVTEMNNCHNIADLMHISPTLLSNHRLAFKTAGTGVFGASCAADMYALGCIANQIYFREHLYSEDEHLEDPGELFLPISMVILKQN